MRQIVQDYVAAIGHLHGQARQLRASGGRLNIVSQLVRPVHGILEVDVEVVIVVVVIIVDVDADVEI